MRRRQFVAGIGSAILGIARPVAAAQQRAPVIGYVGTGSGSATNTALIEQFRRGLTEPGYDQSQGVRISFAWAESSLDRLLDLLAEAVHEQVDVLIAASGSLAALAARSVSTTIPIIFLLADPSVAGGGFLGDRSARNITGITVNTTALIAKRLDLLRAMTAGAALTGLLVNSTAPLGKAQIAEAESAARNCGVHLIILDARAPVEIDRAFATIARQRIAALMVADDPLFLDEGPRLAGFAARQAVPTIYPYRQIVDAGGLMSFGIDAAEAWRLAGAYAARILMGEKPASLSARQMRNTEIAINLESARALGIDVPGTLLGAAVVVE